MHIPDGFLSTEVALACAVPAAVAVGIGLRQANRTLDERRVPLLGVTAAFIFAAQMLNFPVAGGTSGHFLGAALAAILLGPWLACLDTGGRARRAGVRVRGRRAHRARRERVQHGRRRRARRRRADARRQQAVAPKQLLAIAAVGAWLAVMTGAAMTALELAISGTVPLGTVLPAMLGTHATDRRRRGGHHRRRRERRPGHAPGPPPPPRGDTAEALAKPSSGSPWPSPSGSATAVSPFASPQPDGLERVADRQGLRRTRGRRRPARSPTTRSRAWPTNASRPGSRDSPAP